MKTNPLSTPNILSIDDFEPTCFYGAAAIAHAAAIDYARAYYHHTLPCIYLNEPLDNLASRPTESLTNQGISSIIKK